MKASRAQARTMATIEELEAGLNEALGALARVEVKIDTLLKLATPLTGEEKKQPAEKVKKGAG